MRHQLRIGELEEALKQTKNGENRNVLSTNHVTCLQHVSRGEEGIAFVQFLLHPRASNREQPAQRFTLPSYSHQAVFREGDCHMHKEFEDVEV